MNNFPHDDDKTAAFVIPTIGATIAQYKLVDKLGSGGMGDVFKAEDNRLKRAVALKFLSPKVAADETFRARFIREAQSAAALNHPNVVTIYEVAETSAQVYIAMEYVAGRSLRDLMNEGSLTLDQRLDIVLQICRGLAAAHNGGVIHRDIKPENILLDQESRVRILDFGLAKGEGDEQLTQAGMALGTVNYMAPEQAQGAETDYRCDIFGVGALFFELLAGKAPFKRPNLPATIYAVVNEDPPRLKSLVSDLPDDLQLIIDRALAKQPGERYQSIKQMADEIAAVAGWSLQSNITAAMAAAAAQPKVQSLAVLQLRNLGSAEDDFISYGITEDLIVDLTRVGTVRVAPMRSILKYKDSDADLEEIARKLNVTLVLDGSLHRAGDTVRISAQLVDVASGENLWADRWEQAVGNLPQIKQALAEGVVHALQLGSTRVAAAQVGVPEAENAKAYESYLKAKYMFDHKQDTADVDIALGLYRQALKEEPSLVAARAGIAEVLMHQGQFERAAEELEAGLADAEKLDAPADQAMILSLLARLHIRQSEWQEARTYADRALEIVQKARDLAGEVEILGILIAIAQPQGDFDTALRLFDRVLEVSRALDDKEQLAEALKNMGVVYARKADFDRALGLYEEALALAKQEENLSLQAACLSNIGNVHFFRGSLDEAFRHYDQSRQMHTKLGDRAMASRPTLNMGLIELRRGHHHAGLGLLNKAADIFNDTGDRGTYALTLTNISAARLTLGETDRAVLAAEKALSIAREINHVQAESNALQRLALARFYSRELEPAIEAYQTALEVSEKANLSRNVCHIQLELATLHYYRRDYKACEHCAKQAEMGAREIGDKTAVALAATYRAAVTVHDGLYFAGLSQVRDRLKEAEASGDTQITILTRIVLGGLLLNQGRSDDDRAEGRTILTAALEQAKAAELVSEVRWIEELLAPPEGAGS